MKDSAKNKARERNSRHQANSALLVVGFAMAVIAGFLLNADPAVHSQWLQWKMGNFDQLGWDVFLRLCGESVLFFVGGGVFLYGLTHNFTAALTPEPKGKAL
jgi:hypothetical protein